MGFWRENVRWAIIEFTEKMFLAGKFKVGDNGVLAEKCVVGDN